MDKSTYAHEFTHALQDQHFDLDALDPEGNSDDASLAVAALIEGDATLLMQQYMLEYLDPNELFDLFSESLDAGSEALEQAPAVIREQMMFPYEVGLTFVQALYQHGGYQAVNAAFARPPRSTEQVLHPDRYLAGELPQVVNALPLTNTLGSGWEWVDGNVLGELTLRLYLEEQVNTRTAASAADGWGGDWYDVYTHQGSGAIVMVMQTVWDTEAEAAEFIQTYQTFGKARFGSASQAPTQTSTCWSGSDAICAYHSGTQTLVIRAPDMELVTQLAVLFPDFY